MTSQQLTTTLRIAVAATAAAVIGVSGLFAYNVYLDRAEAIQSTPALRVVEGVKKQVRARPNDAALRVRLGEALAAAGKSQEAIEQFNAAIKIDEKHVGAHLDLGMVAMLNDRDAEAIKYFEKVVELTDANEMRFVDARREQAFFALGQMALSAKEYEKAVGYFKEATRIRRDSSDTYLQMSRAFVGIEDTDAAIKYIEYALAFDPGFAEANYLAGELYLEKKDFLKASEHIRKAVDAAPDSREPMLLLQKLGTAESWEEKARKQLASDPSEALGYIKIARRIDTASIELAILHGEILEKLGKKKEALTVYKEALELDASDKKLEAAVARLEAKPKKSK